MSSEPRLSTIELSDDDRPEWKRQTSERTHAILSRMTTVIGRKWQPVVIYCLLRDGSLGFSDLESEIDGISSKMLSQTLADLEERELIDRTVINTKPFRVEYSLTEAGRTLEPVIAAMIEWGERTAGRSAIEPEVDETASGPVSSHERDSGIDGPTDTDPSPGSR